MKSLIIPIALALAVAACGPRVSTDGKTTTVTGANGATITAGQGAPANLPGYITVYPGATVTAGAAFGPGGGMLGQNTNDTPDKVIAYYKNIAAANGLIVATETAPTPDGDHSQVVDFRQAEPGKKNFVLTLSVRDGHTEVGILYGPQS